MTIRSYINLRTQKSKFFVLCFALTSLLDFRRTLLVKNQAVKNDNVYINFSGVESCDWLSDGGLFGGNQSQQGSSCSWRNYTRK